MEKDFFIESYFSVITETLTPKQNELMLNLESILRNSLRDDFALLCNCYELYKTCNNSEFLQKANLCFARLNSEYRFTEVMAKFFGFEERYIYDLLRISSKFISFADVGKKYVITELNDYSISKLRELLPLSINEIQLAFLNKDLTNKSTVRDIRNFVKMRRGVQESEPDDVEVYSCDDVGRIELELPMNLIEFCRKMINPKKYKSISEFIIALIKEKM